MGSIRRLLLALINNSSSSINNRVKETEREKSSFMENGSMLLEELIVSWNGRCDNPLRSFSAQEVITATNNFDRQHRVASDAIYVLYEGLLERRTIFVKKYGWDKGNWSPDFIKSSAIHDTVITSQMSSHNNVLKLIGCCLEFQFPALVYERRGDAHVVLSGLIYNNSGHDERSLSWKNKLRIANGIANAILYLHTAFPRPIIHRNLKPNNVIIDQSGVAKLFDFSLSIAIPAGESRVEDEVCGTPGFLDPEYATNGFLAGKFVIAETGFLTEKSDVYSIGVLLLELLKEESILDLEYDEDLASLVEDYLADKDQLNKALDPRVMQEGARIEQEQQIAAFGALVLKCVQLKGDDRPEMIEVAKELRRIERSIHSS